MKSSKLAMRMNEHQIKGISISIGAALLFLIGGIHAYGSPILGYKNATVGNGNQAWTGNLALTFNVTSPVAITDLGVFDNNLASVGAANGSSTGTTNGATIKVGIYCVSGCGAGVTADVTQLAEYTFAPSTNYSVAAGSVDLIAAVTPVKLAPGGEYEVVAVGFTSGFKDAAANAGYTSFNGSPQLTVAGSTYNAATSLGYVSNPIQYYNGDTFGVTGPFPNGGTHFEAGTFEFVPTPEPGTLLLMGSGVLGLAGMVRRKIRKIVS